MVTSPPLVFSFSFSTTPPLPSLSLLVPNQMPISACRLASSQLPLSLSLNRPPPPFLPPTPPQFPLLPSSSFSSPQPLSRPSAVVCPLLMRACCQSRKIKWSRFTSTLSPRRITLPAHPLSLPPSTPPPLSFNPPPLPLPPSSSFPLLPHSPSEELKTMMDLAPTAISDNA